jgi:hypothetical protein
LFDFSQLAVKNSSDKFFLHRPSIKTTSITFRSAFITMASPPIETPVNDDDAANKQDTEAVPTLNHNITSTTPFDTSIKKKKRPSPTMRSPPAVLALGAVLEHIMTCDCSFRHVKNVLADESNDTLKIAYQHHAANSTPATVV